MTQIHSPASTAQQVHALLTDGTTVRIRQAEPADHDAVLGLYEEMSPENLRLRFFAASHRSAGLAADRACARRTGRLPGAAGRDGGPGDRPRRVRGR